MCEQGPATKKSLLIPLTSKTDEFEGFVQETKCTVRRDHDTTIIIAMTARVRKDETENTTLFSSSLDNRMITRHRRKNKVPDINRDASWHRPAAWRPARTLVRRRARLSGETAWLTAGLQALSRQVRRPPCPFSWRLPIPEHLQHEECPWRRTGGG